MPTINLHVPDSLFIHRAISVEEFTKESQFVLASYLYAKGYLSSGAAADICGMNRADFLLTMGHSGIPVADLDGYELDREVENA